MKFILSFLCGFFNPVRQMVNAMDHRAMLLDLLGLDTSATEDMVNEMFSKAKTTPPDEMAKQMKSKCNELETSIATLRAQITEKETLAANETKAKTTAETKLAELQAAKTAAETSFANERTSRIKLIVANAVSAGQITKAEVDDTTKTLANTKDFESEVATLEKKAKKINTASQTSGLNNQIKGTSNASTLFANEVSKRQRENAGEDYLTSWKAVESTEQGKSLLASMHHPEAGPK